MMCRHELRSDWAFHGALEGFQCTQESPAPAAICLKKY
jgi:hypothetical protein